MFTIFRLLLLLLLTVTVTVSKAQVLKVTTSDNVKQYWPIMEKVLKQAGFIPVLEILPGERGMAALLRGDVDIDLVRTKVALQGNEHLVIFIGPTACSETVLYARADKNLAKVKVEDLKNYTLGVTLTYRTGIAFAEQHNLYYQRPSNRESLFRMLKADRFSLAIDGRAEGLTVIRQLGFEKEIVEILPPITSTYVYLILNVNQKKWANRIRRAFEKSITSGEYQKDFIRTNLSLGLPPSIGISCLNP